MDWASIVKFLGGSTLIVAAIGWLIKSIADQWFKRDIEHVKATLTRIEQLESELTKSRGEAYGEVWTLTGSIALFGPGREVTSEKLSAELSEWYFARGWVITTDSKRSYFLVQEVLSFLILRSMSFKRPPDEYLFGSAERAIARLEKIREQELQIPARGETGDYSIDELELWVSNWKTKESTRTGDEKSPERAWVLLQLVMSAFRSRLVKELGSRKSVET